MKTLEKSVGKQRVKTRAKNRILRSRSFSSYNRSGNIDYFWTRFDQEMIDISAFSIDDIEVSLANLLGFTTKGFVTLPWELTRLSFVADWLANVGHFIGAISPAPGWNQLGSSLTVRRDSTSRYIATNSVPWNNDYSVITPWSGSYMVRQLTISRSLNPTPSLVINADFGFDRSTRVADSLALLSQQLLRVFRR